MKFHKQCQMCLGAILMASFWESSFANNISNSLTAPRSYSHPFYKIGWERKIGNNDPGTVCIGNDGVLRSTTSLQTTICQLRGGANRRKPSKGKTTTLASKTKRSSWAKKKSSKQQGVSKTASGATRVGKQVEKPSALDSTMQKYKSILPLTRIYITLVGISTLLGTILGDEAAQVLLGLDPIRTVYGLEIWRPITAASFLGPPSIGWLMSAYYLFEYGSTLERVYGTAQHFVFVMGQVLILSIYSMLFGQPFFASSMITAMLHVLSRSMPHQKVKWLIFTVPYWTLPYGLMASDVLQGGAAAAMPHVLGILSGHFYYFHKFIWPKMGGEDWLVAPDFLVRRLDTSRNTSSDVARKSVEMALKKRKKGAGRKLGSS